jgi:hypothetical protein
VACLLLAGGYVAWATIRDDDSGAETATPRRVPNLHADGLILFQNVSLDAGYANIAWVPLGRPGSKRALSGIICERVHFSGGRGLCLRPRRNVLAPAYYAVVLDSRLRATGKIQLPGINNRARVSPDGRYAAATGFIVGDSYLDVGFSTRTFLIDVARAKVLANLEDFAVYQDGERIRSIDFNFWGVTFARRSNQFYATLRTKGRNYLVRGDVARRRLDVVRDGVECPSLSPDNTRVAFKLRQKRQWRIAVLDLRTNVVTPLAETQSIDDQPEWLDNDHVLYGKDAAIRAVRADGGGRPRTLIEDALSPAVVRPNTTVRGARA